MELDSSLNSIDRTALSRTSWASTHQLTVLLIDRGLISKNEVSIAMIDASKSFIPPTDSADIEVRQFLFDQSQIFAIDL